MGFSYNVSVTTVDEIGINNPPVVGADVSIRDSSGTVVTSGLTNQNGQFITSGMYNGPDINANNWIIRIHKLYDYAGICAENKIPNSPVVAQTFFLGRGYNYLFCEVNVVDFNTLNPVAGIKVSAHAPGGRFRGSGITDALGNVELFIKPEAGDSNNMDGWHVLVSETEEGPKKYQLDSGCWVRPTGYRRCSAKIFLLKIA